MEVIVNYKQEELFWNIIEKIKTTKDSPLSLKGEKFIVFNVVVPCFSTIDIGAFIVKSRFVQMIAANMQLALDINQLHTMSIIKRIT